MSVALTVFISCSKEKKAQVALKPINEPQSITEDYRNVDFINLSKSDLLAAGRGTIVICSWEEWGRKNHDCKKWGLCDFTWFPQTPTARYNAPIVQDSNGKYYLEILFANIRPTSSDFDNLPIDQDILVNTEGSIIGRNLVAKAGLYPYNSSMGSFGGYKIWLN